MFNFRIITTAEGLEIIDRTLTTSSDLLNPFELMDYVALEDTLAFMDRKRRISRKRFLLISARNPNVTWGL